MAIHFRNEEMEAEGEIKSVQGHGWAKVIRSVWLWSSLISSCFLTIQKPLSIIKELTPPVGRASYGADI